MRPKTLFLAVVTAVVPSGLTAQAGQDVALSSPITDVAPVSDGALQLRLIERSDRHQLVAEVDRGAGAHHALLLASGEDGRTQPSSALPALLATPVGVAMTRRNALTFAIEIDLDAVQPGTRVYLQAAAIDALARVRASAIARFDVRAGLEVDPAPYAGPAFTVASAATSCVWPHPCSYAVTLSVTVPTNDWALLHQLTYQGPGRTDVWVVLKAPAPDEGALDVIETHELVVDAGPRALGSVRVLVATTHGWPQNTHGLRFHPLPADYEGLGRKAPVSDRSDKAISDRSDRAGSGGGDRLKAHDARGLGRKAPVSDRSDKAASDHSDRAGSVSGDRLKAQDAR